MNTVLSTCRTLCCRKYLFPIASHVNNRVLPQKYVASEFRAFASLRVPRQAGTRLRIINPAVKRIQPREQDTNNYPYQQWKQHDVAPSDPRLNRPVSLPPNNSGIIDRHHPISRILAQPAIIITRQLEMMQLLVGYDQENKYAIVDPYGNPLGFIVEEDSFGKSISRQFLGTRRRFSASILDINGNILLKVWRPFVWFLTSRIYVMTENDQIIGEVHQKFHLLRRQYELFVGKKQFALIDAPPLSWDFEMKNENNECVALINKNFRGFGREIFTDTSQFVLRMDAVSEHGHTLSLAERTVALACAINIDIDFFSRHSSGSGGFMWLPMGMSQGEDSYDHHNSSESDNSVPPVSTGAPFSSEQQSSMQKNLWGDELVQDDRLMSDEASQENDGNSFGGWGGVLTDFFSDDK
ncbi:uncharacterized protein VTP21DRAFT_3043 [Calcarisporiella thermophila]|uniref:uncharacterized protein n=1 Tax=Calcarisporiella thermophila TaxID=911321 RepID=UPI0037443623